MGFSWASDNRERKAFSPVDWEDAYLGGLHEPNMTTVSSVSRHVVNDQYGVCRTYPQDTIAYY